MINAESTKCHRELQPEVFVFTVHYLYLVQTRSHPLIGSVHFEVTDHERITPLLYYLDLFYGACGLEEVSTFMTISPFLSPSPSIGFISFSEWTRFKQLLDTIVIPLEGLFSVTAVTIRTLEKFSLHQYWVRETLSQGGCVRRLKTMWCSIY